MSKIAGVDVSIITKLAGASVAAITKLCGRFTTELSSWPGQGGGGGEPTGPTCTTVSFSDPVPLANDPRIACRMPLVDYDYDATNNILYPAGECGGKTVKDAYYSDGRTIYQTSRGVLTALMPCR